MRIAVIIPFRQHASLLQWTLAGYAQQRLAPQHALEIHVGVDGGLEQPVPLTLDLPDSPPIRIHNLPRSGAAAVRNMLVQQTSPDSELIIFGNSDARPEPDMVQCHIDALAQNLPPNSLVLGSAPWETSAAPTVWDALLADTPMVFFYHQLEPGCWYDFRHAWTLNLSVRRADFLAAGGFPAELRPVYYEDLALGYRLLGKDRKGVLYEPRARVLHRHPTTIDQYLDREELLGIMAPVLARHCPPAFDMIFGTRDLQKLVLGYRDWVKMDAAMMRHIYRRLQEWTAVPADTLGAGEARQRLLMTIYQMHMPLKRLAFRLGFLKGIKLAEDCHWQERKPEGQWRSSVL
jgi:hypothetical protein